MYAEINLLGAGILILVFAALHIISYSGRKPASFPSTSNGFFKKTSKKERRAYPRYKVSLRIKYKTSSEKEGISWIKDISEGGARLFLNNILKALETGESLQIEINLPYDPQPILIQGNIVWSKENDAGFQFNNIIQGDIKRIIQYINNKELI